MSKENMIPIRLSNTNLKVKKNLEKLVKKSSFKSRSQYLEALVSKHVQDGVPLEKEALMAIET